MRNKKVKQCPDNETLTTFLDYSLDDEQNNFVIDHLKDCSECREKVETMIKDEKELFTALFDLPTEKPYKESVGEMCPQRESMWSYAEGHIQVEQQAQIEEHLQSCDDCLIHLMEIQEELLQPQLEFDTAGVLSAIEEMHAKDRTAPHGKGKDTSGGILELILKIGERSLEVIRYTGELIVSQPRLAVRGGEQKEKKPQALQDTVCIRKDFEDTETSVEITIRKEAKKDTVCVNISVMKLETEHEAEEFMNDIMIILSGQELQIEKITNNEGKTEFEDIPLGEYEIKLVNDEGRKIGKGILEIK